MPIGLGAALLGGAAIGGLSSLATSAFNVHESRQNRRFQRDMANSEMQRKVADLRRAGLNPMLAVSGHGAGGATTPHTQAAQVEAPRGVGPELGLQAMQAHAGIQETQARTAKELAEIGKIKMETQFGNDSMEDRIQMQRQTLLHELDKKDLTNQQRDHIQAQIIKIEKEFNLLDVQTSHSAFDLDRMRAESAMYKTLGGWGAAGKAGLLRIPNLALQRVKGVAAAGKQVGRHGVNLVKRRGKIRRINTGTGELLD